MKCPDCDSEVTGEVAFCFTCLRHVPEELLIPSDDDAAHGETVVEEKLGQRGRRAWEPGIIGSVQAFGRAAANSTWRRTRAEPS
jgi:hypothetical protein